MACADRSLRSRRGARLPDECPRHGGGMAGPGAFRAGGAHRVHAGGGGLPWLWARASGGGGAKTSLLLAPMVACCGVAVPMISGGGLGHTGGTLDKLEAIPGFNVNLSFTQFKRIIKKCGFGLAGQTRQIAPADKKLYALRDAT